MLRLLCILMGLATFSAWAQPLKISADEALRKANSGEMTIVDIRLPMEWEKTGLPATAIGISLQDEAFKPREAFVGDLLKLVDGDRSAPIALICATGARSAYAEKLLAANGFTNLHDITEGMLGGPNGPGWTKRKLPTSPCLTC
ncbi:MAG: rhodanese-like domain-containing protein [Pseudomonadota bacterium]